MANVKTIEGVVVDAQGVVLASKTATLKNNGTGATVASGTTDANGKFSFANQDETIVYRVEVAVGGASTQVFRRSPASPEFDHLYINTSLRSAAAATVAFGGAVSMAGLTATTGAFSGAVTMPTNGLNVGSGQFQVAAGGVAMGAGQAIVFAAEVKDNKLDLFGSGGGYGIGIAASTMKFTVPLNNFYRYYINAVLSLEAGPNQVLVRDGTAALPGVSFISDPDTGIYHPVGTNVVAIAANGAVEVTVGAGAIGFFAAAATTKQAVTGSRGGNAALASLLTSLANYGLITDSSTA